MADEKFPELAGEFLAVRFIIRVKEADLAIAAKICKAMRLKPLALPDRGDFKVFQVDVPTPENWDGKHLPEFKRARIAFRGQQESSVLVKLPYPIWAVPKPASAPKPERELEAT